MYRIFLFLLCLIQTRVCVDYYDLLGIQKDAENREIRKAFKKLALKYHPDKNKEQDASEMFIAINKAYEVLKDDEMRKKYDLYGEDGLKEDFKESWKGNYRSWNYYYESFGIYDDDPEIVTLSRNDFERLVLDSSDIWFVNFYSPQCSHCHYLAPAWRKLAQELQKVIQIGAVNCEEDWLLCRQQNIYSYPSLILYPEKKKYEGFRETEDMVNYALQKLPYKVIHLTSSNYVEQISSQELSSQPWLIFFCNGLSCFPEDLLKKIGIILEHIVSVAAIDCQNNEHVCELISSESPIMYFPKLSISVLKGNLKGVAINDTNDVNEIVEEVLHLLPEPQEISNQDLEKIRKELELTNSIPWLIQFTKEEASSAKKDIDLKRLKSFLPHIFLGCFNCYYHEATCKYLHIYKFPSFLLFRPGGSYEFHYGHATVYDVSRFAHEALISQVHTLSPEHFPEVTQSTDLWFIDFFAPWCPPCMQFLPQFRKASNFSGHLVKFGTVDCTTHRQLCQSYNINSYPSAILYNGSISHKFHGRQFQQVNEFIQDILTPVVVSLTPSSFEDKLINKKIEDVWVIDFFVPWCGPCQQLAPEWRKMAKMIMHLSAVHVGEVDCQAHQSFCSFLRISSYPTIRLYPRGSMSAERFFSYNGWSREALSLQAWIYDFLHSKVQLLTDVEFQKVLADSTPWLIDFFVPWCAHCQTFAPEFEKITLEVEGIVKTGKINCDESPTACHLASIHAYPTVRFYKGLTGSKPQDPVAGEINILTFNGIILFLENSLNLKFKRHSIRLPDELDMKKNHQQ